jgi:hypothetical protein
VAVPYLFICYAQADNFDRAISRRLLLLLRRPLEGLGRIFLDAESIEPASLIGREIGQRIAESEAALLLVSPDFVGSDYIHDHELPAILREFRRVSATCGP